jgi:hypothetical protein
MRHKDDDDGVDSGPTDVVAGMVEPGTVAEEVMMEVAVIGTRRNMTFSHSDIDGYQRNNFLLSV